MACPIDSPCGGCNWRYRSKVVVRQRVHGLGIQHGQVAGADVVADTGGGSRPVVVALAVVGAGGSGSGGAGVSGGSGIAGGVLSYPQLDQFILDLLILLLQLDLEQLGVFEPRRAVHGFRSVVLLARSFDGVQQRVVVESSDVCELSGDLFKVSSGL